MTKEKAIETMKHWIDYEKENKDKINKADELIEIQETVLSMLKGLQRENKRLTQANKSYKGMINKRDTKIKDLSNQLLMFFKEKDNLNDKISRRDKEIEELKENIDYQVLCDFLISSVGNEEPIWTEKHIEELLENFEVRWKNAHK